MRRAPRREWRRRASSARRGGRACRPRRGCGGPPRRWCRRGGRRSEPRGRSSPSAVEDAARDLVAARDAAEDVEEDRAHLVVARDHLERSDDAGGRAAAAEVAEVRGPPAGDDDHVDGRHREAGAVAEDPDRAVELHVDDAALAGERLERVGRLRVAQLGEVRRAGRAPSRRSSPWRRAREPRPRA